MSPKAPTLVPGADRSVVRVFEGFFDFLSSLVWFGEDAPSTDCLILNSLAFAKRSVAGVQAGYRHCELFLDNDAAGERAAVLFEGATNRAPEVYAGFKDFNEFLVSRTSTSI